MPPLLRPVDGYCERLDPGYWAEPVNALTNAAFLIAALAVWRLAHRPLAGSVRGLLVLLTAIGIGSWLFHTHAQVWAGIADVLPILGFILAYLYAANRHYWGLSALWAGLGMLAFFPWAALTLPVFRALPGFSVSAGYWPVALLIGVYALALARRLPQVARGLGIGGGLLCLSLTARSLDMPLCAALPLGTHWLWHVLNAVLLGWLILVLDRHLHRGQGQGAARRPHP